MAGKLSEITDYDCYMATITAVFAMLHDDKSAAFVQQHIGLSSDVIAMLRKIPNKDVKELVDIILARKMDKAITLRVDTALVTKIVSSINKLKPSEVSLFITKVNEQIAQDRYLLPVYEKYLSCINQVVSQCLTMDADTTLEAYIPPALVCAMMDLKAAYLPAVLLALFKHNAIRFVVNELSFNTVLAAYKARMAGKEVVLKLIRSGANLDFIRQHNGHIDVSPVFVKKWRKIYQVSKASEEVSVYKGNEIYHDFHALMQQRLTTLDIYFQLHRKYGYRIDTLYLYINNALQAESESEHDIDDDEESGTLFFINRVG